MSLKRSLGHASHTGCDLFPWRRLSQNRSAGQAVFLGNLPVFPVLIPAWVLRGWVSVARRSGAIPWSPFQHGTYSNTGELSARTWAFLIYFIKKKRKKIVDLKMNENFIFRPKNKMKSIPSVFLFFPLFFWGGERLHYEIKPLSKWNKTHTQMIK